MYLRTPKSKLFPYTTLFRSPTSVTTSRRTDGSPRAASSMVGIVVTSRSSIILGLVRANSERATTRAERRPARAGSAFVVRSEEHTSELQSQFHLVCRLLHVK